MRVLTVEERKNFECDECNQPLTDREAILIGENSHAFAEDTCQATVCLQCIQRASYKLIESVTWG